MNTYNVAIAGDGQQGLDLFRSEHPIAVVQTSSFAGFCRVGSFARSQRPPRLVLPVIVLSAITEVADKVFIGVSAPT